MGIQLAEPLGQIGQLVVRLAKSEAEILAAQKVRHRVFVNELGARPSDHNDRDHDQFDQHCDHLVVLDKTIPGDDVNKIVGTYRLMGPDHAQQAGGYYSANEFDVTSLINKHPARRFLELGRSCVLPPYRSKRTIELLWQGIWAYAQGRNLDVMMGCASFHGTIPARHAEALSFLYHQARADVPWRISSKPEKSALMDLMPAEAINARVAVSKLPPLIKGYVRLGAQFGSEAVIDEAFNTIDVMVILPVENISPRYKAHYGENATRFAA